MYYLFKAILTLIVFVVLLFIRSTMPRYKIDSVLKKTWKYLIIYYLTVLLIVFILTIL